MEDKIKMKDIVLKIKYVGLKENDVWIKTDQKRLQQILLNLFSNAIKFTNIKGKIFIVAKVTEDNKLLVSVIDNGIGIKEENHSKLFKLFGSIRD